MLVDVNDPLVDMKDPVVSFAKSRQAIIGTVTNRGHCISGATAASANDATLKPCAACKQIKIGATPLSAHLVVAG